MTVMALEKMDGVTPTTCNYHFGTVYLSDFAGSWPISNDIITNATSMSANKTVSCYF